MLAGQWITLSDQVSKYGHLPKFTSKIFHSLAMRPRKHEETCEFLFTHFKHLYIIFTDNKNTLKHNCFKDPIVVDSMVIFVQCKNNFL